MAAPPRDSAEYRWYRQGALDEVLALREGISGDALEVIDFLHNAGQSDRYATDTKAEVAALVARVFMAGTPLGARIRLAWRVVTGR